MLEQLQQDMHNCQKCKLSNGRSKIVFGAGNPKAPVLVIGEAPGYWEDQSGEPFVGNAGELLDKMLGSIGLSRKTNCYIANVIKCRPPENRQPELEEIRQCAEFLKKQIEIIDPKFIITTGAYSTSWLLNQDFEVPVKITPHVGKLYKYKNIPFVPIFHPSYLLRNEEKKATAWENLQFIYEQLELLNVVE